MQPVDLILCAQNVRQTFRVLSSGCCRDGIIGRVKTTGEINHRIRWLFGDQNCKAYRCAPMVSIHWFKTDPIIQMVGLRVVPVRHQRCYSHGIR